MVVVLFEAKRTNNMIPIPTTYRSDNSLNDLATAKNSQLMQYLFLSPLDVHMVNIVLMSGDHHGFKATKGLCTDSYILHTSYVRVL